MVYEFMGNTLSFSTWIIFTLLKKKIQVTFCNRVAGKQ